MKIRALVLAGATILTTLLVTPAQSMAATGQAHAALSAKTASPQDANPVSWANPAPVGGGSSTAPTLGDCNGSPFLVWKGVGNDQNMWFSTMNSSGQWAPQQVLGGGGGTSDRPAVTCWGNNILVAWKGVGSDTNMYYTTSSDHGGTWADQKLVDNGGQTSTGLSGTYITFVDPSTPSGSWIAWKGAGLDEHGYVSRLLNTGHWSTPVQAPVQIDTPPTLSTLGTNQPQFMWRSSDSALHGWTFDGWTWHAQFSLSGDGGSSTTPSAVYWGGTFAVWKGILDDQHLYYTTAATPQSQVNLGNLTDGSPTVGTLYVRLNPCPGGGFCDPGKAVVVWRSPADSSLQFTISNDIRSL